MNFFLPMTPATTGPELTPIRNASLSSPNVRVATALAHVQRKLHKSGRVVRPLPRHPRRDHVAVADRLDLLQIVFLDQPVEAKKHLVELINQLHRRQLRRHWRETDNVREQDTDGRILIGDRTVLNFEHVRYPLRQDVEQ